MNGRNQKKYFIIGQVLMAFALFCVTFLPKLLKMLNFSVLNSVIKEYTYVQLEFFILWICAVFFVLCPKYYKYQITTVLFGVIYYILFVKFYPLIF